MFNIKCRWCFNQKAFLYTAEDKAIKIFGPDDNDALSLLAPSIEIRFFTGGKKDFAISKKRIVNDISYPLNIGSTGRRVEWIRERYSLNKIIYMRDSGFDHYVMCELGYEIAPVNADKLTKQHANFVTEQSGDDRAVAEACLHIMENFSLPLTLRRYLSHSTNLQVIGLYDSSKT